MLMLSIVFSVFAAFGISSSSSATEYNGFEYTRENGTVSINNFPEKLSGKAVIPSYIEGLPVTSIGNINGDISEITEVVLPEKLEYISVGVFSGCKYLTYIDIPASVCHICRDVFSGCSSLNDIEFLGNSPVEIAEKAFDGTAYYNDPSNWEDGILYIGKHIVATNDSVSGIVDIRKGTLSIADSAFLNRSEITQITIPDGVGFIGGYAFSGCTGLTTVTVPGSVKSMLNCVFKNCSSLENVIFCDGVERLGEIFTEGCDNLTQISLPDSIGYIASSIFYGTKILKNIVPEKGMYYIGKHLIYADEEVVSGNVVVRDGTITIAAGAFQECLLVTSVEFPSSLRHICQRAFDSCSNLKSVKFSEGIEAIDFEAFAGCPLPEFNLPKSIKTIGTRAFYSKAYSSSPNWDRENGLYYEGSIVLANSAKLPEIVTVKNGTTILADGVLSNYNVKKVVVPAGVTCFGWQYFNNPAFESVTFLGDAPDIVSISCPPDGTVYYYYGAKGFTSPMWKGIRCLPIDEKMGDINGDGTADIEDAMLLFYGIAKKEAIPDSRIALCEFNADGNVDIGDAMILFYYVAKKTDTLGLCG